MPPKSRGLWGTVYKKLCKIGENLYKNGLFRAFRRPLTPSFGCSNHFAPASVAAKRHFWQVFSRKPVIFCTWRSFFGKNLCFSNLFAERFCWFFYKLGSFLGVILRVFSYQNSILCSLLSLLRAIETLPNSACKRLSLSYPSTNVPPKCLQLRPKRRSLCTCW